MALTSSTRIGLLLAVLASAHVSESSAQSRGRDRIKEIREVYIWQRASLSERELRQALTAMRSSDPAVVRGAVETIALAKPIPPAAELVVETLIVVEQKVQDQTTRLVATEACRDWSEARNAWKILQEARPRGGFRALEQVLTQGRSPKKGQAMVAAAYSEDERAPRLLAEHWRDGRVHGARALEIVGPPAAPFLAEQLSTDERGLSLEVAPLLGMIGTEAQIPALMQAGERGTRLLKIKSAEAIAEIRARAVSPE